MKSLMRMVVLVALASAGVAAAKPLYITVPRSYGTQEPVAVDVAFEDKGPGIPNVDLALSDGWTSGSGLGIGLSGSKRLVNEFELRTVVGEGTCVTITRWK